jgi:hypothetical protein
MKPTRDGWSIVLAGAWNPRIFTPAWLTANVFHSQSLSVEFPVQPLAPYRFSANGVMIVPSHSRVILSPQNLRDETLAELERQAINVLELLPHTPLEGAGTNYRFDEADPSDALRRIFDFPDAGDVAAAGYTVPHAEISRLLTWDGSSVTFKLTRGASGITASFNFHLPATAAATAVEHLRGAVLRNRDRAADILAATYAIRPELQEAV